MKHIYYHVSTDKHNAYLDSLEDAKSIATKWNNEGDSNIQVFKTKKREEGDVINLGEESLSLKEIFKN